MRFKNFFLISGLALMCTTAYSAEHFTPQMTTEIAQHMSDKAIGAELSVNGQTVKKINDPTAPNGVLEREVQSAIEKSLQDHHYSEEGQYAILVHQPLEGHNIYRVIEFLVDTAKNIKNIKEVALVELTRPSVAEQVHQEVVAEHVHEVPQAIVPEHVHEVAENRTHEENHVHQEVVVAEHVHEAPLAIVPEHVHMVPEERILEENHVHQIIEEHIHEVPQAIAPEHVHMAPEERIHEENHVHHQEALAEPSSFFHRLTGLLSSTEEHVHGAAERTHH